MESSTSTEAQASRGLALKPSESSGHESLRTLVPIRGDLYSWMLIRRLDGSPIGYALANLAMLSFVTILINYLSGTLFPSASLKGALFSKQWITHWTVIPLLCPLLYFGIARIYASIPDTLADLIDSRVVTSRAGIDAMRGRLEVRYSSKWAQLVLIVMTCVFAAIFFHRKLQQTGSDWTHIVPGELTISGWYYGAALSLQFYVIASLTYVVTVTGLEIRRMFHDDQEYVVELRLLHPDGVCGLGPITVLVFRLSVVIASLGLLSGAMVATGVFRLGFSEAMKEPGHPLALLAFVVVAPLAFFLPLWPAHKKMRELKAGFLGELATQYESCFHQMRDSLGQGRTDVEALDELKAIDRLYQQTQKIPIWPFDAATLRRFTVTVLTPFAAPAAAIVFDRFFRAE